MNKIDIKVYFNFRSPYCYLASKRMFDVIVAPDIQIIWCPLGGWNGRSAPDRVAYKLPIVRQDVARWCRRLEIPFVPPPIETEPTNAALGSLLAERDGRLPEYIFEVMREEWEFGQNIGLIEPLLRAAKRAGVDSDQLLQALTDENGIAKLHEFEESAKTDGAFGVPTFVVGKEVFWGNDRLDFLAEHIASLRVASLRA